MHIRSEAQRRKLLELVKSGKVTQRDYDKLSRTTGGKKLPERITPKAPSGGRR